MTNQTRSDSGSLAERMNAIVANIPEQIEARIKAGNDRLAGSGSFGIEVGATAPNFSLPNATGDRVDLADLLAEGPVVVAFYRGEWCPFCNLELRALQAHLGEITARGARLVAISPQAPDHSLSLTEKLGLGFDVLSDEDQSVIEAYDLQFTVDGDTRDLVENVFKGDYGAQNADGTWRLPVPATFVLDRSGVVRASHVDTDYRTRMEPVAVVSALDALP